MPLFINFTRDRIMNIEHTEINGITLDTDTGLYTVWDESSSLVICTTPFMLLAKAALDAYVEEFLND